MRLAYITAGAAGMYCGSCMRDNTLVAALNALGHDALLVPTYTPIRTDEEDVSSHNRVFFGGLNVYLQQKFSLFRHTPAFLDRLLDFRGLLKWISGFAVQIEARQLGELTVSMLKGDHGYQSKEVAKLAHYLADEVKPQLINLTNVLLAGLVPELKRLRGVPVLATLQGDDIFLEGLTEPYKSQAMELVRGHCREIDGFLTTSRYYADFMSGYLDIPREKIHVVWPGLNLKGHGQPSDPPRPPRSPLTVGYFARIAPEKGLHNLVNAFGQLCAMPDVPYCRLRIAGYLGGNNRAYFDEQKKKLETWGLLDRFEHHDCPDHESKVWFLQGLDVMSVPTTYREPKGLYVLEAWANAVPVVQPRHGSFPELIEATGAGLLVEPNDPTDLARAIAELLRDGERRNHLGRTGQAAVHERFHAPRMAAETVAVYEQYTPQVAPT